MSDLRLSLQVGLSTRRRGRRPVLPAGFVFLVNDDGAYLIDENGAYLITMEGSA